MTCRRHAYFLISTLAIASACSDEPTGAGPLTPLDRVTMARGVSIPTVSLIVTIFNADALGNSYNIQNDGQGAYTDGSQDVQAILDPYGTFTFNTEIRNNRNATRWVTYNFNSPIDLSNVYRPTPSNLKNYHFSTGPSANSPFIPIQNLGINGNPASECIYMGNSIASSSTSWRVSFHKGNEDLGNGQTAYAVVTRTSVTPAVWTITPTGSCSPVSNVASLRSADGSLLYGYYNLPFRFTLTAK